MLSRRLTALALAALVVAVTPGAAAASSNVGPSTAPTVVLGTPFAGTWFQTPWLHPGREGPTHWWRVGATIRPGDRVQVALDNTQASIDARTCLVPPVDEFGADSALGACSRYDTSEGALRRFTMRYSGATGQPLVVVEGNSEFAASSAEYGNYSATVEKVVTRVNIGAVAPRRIRRSFRFRAKLRYGDNTPAADGLRGLLQWRRVRGGSGPRKFTKLARARSAGSKLKFKARLPRRARRKVLLRACVAEPGGGLRCTGRATVRLRGR